MVQRTVNLVESYLNIRPHGAAEVMPKGGVGATSERDDTVVWDPEADGLLVSEALVTTSSRHQGERHLDGDEVLYLISGSARLALERDDGSPEVIDLPPARAFVVPQRVWHRLLVDEPSRLLFLTTGRTEVRPPTPAS